MIYRLVSGLISLLVPHVCPGIDELFFLGYNTSMNQNKLLQMLRITQKYYIQHMSQKDIAQEEGISVPTVSRMISRAMESGYVNISIDYSFLSEEELAAEICRLYKLRRVTIVPVVISEPEAVLLDTCKAAARRLEETLTSGMTIGTAWGNTMKCLASCIRPMDLHDIKVVQVNGRSADVDAARGCDDMVRALISSTGGKGYTLPAPAVVDNTRTADMLKSDSGVKSVLQLAGQCDLLVFSAGSLSKNSIMYKSGFLDHGLYESLESAGAVGDIASGYFDFNGNIIDQELSGRRISLPLEELKSIPIKLCVASGKEKAPVLHGAVKGGFVDELVIDGELGRALIALV